MLLVSQLDAGSLSIAANRPKHHELLRSLLVFGTGAINRLLGQCDRCQFTTHYFLDERMTAKALKRDRDLYEKSASFDKCRPQWLLTEMYSARPNRALS